MRPIVALLTDFGTRDYYVGAMKGAILAVCPDAQLVDVTHNVAPQDVAEGAFTLGACYRALPADTVFVAVVDPGVGTSRRAVALEAGGYRFVSPDNGILSLVLADHPVAALHEIVNSGLFRSRVSPTFHARDVFGPVAGHLARGAPLGLVGPVVRGPVVLPVPRARRDSSGRWHAEVIHQDRFGNLTTSLRGPELESILEDAGGDARAIVIAVGGIVLPLVRTYGDVREGDPCALLGSSERLEIGVNRGNAASVLGLGKGAPVTVSRAGLVL
jgi:S-adenosyl-L-methionine hydrolase (adenosine-forming)